MSANNNIKFSSESEADTAEAARTLAQKLRSGDVVFLEGDLGTGKTVFARALIRALTGNPATEVPSPTFTLLQTYETAAGTLWHFDLYRLEDAEEVYELGWEEALAEGIALIEWPQRLGALAPAARLTVSLRPLSDNPNQREITLIPHGHWAERFD